MRSECAWHWAHRVRRCYAWFERGVVLAVVGIAIGALAAAMLARLMESLLYEIPPRDPLTYVAVCSVLAAVALTATYIPALRATRVDPTVALRYE